MEKDSNNFLLTVLETIERISRWSMDKFTLIQLAYNCCPKLLKKVFGVASSDNFFSGRVFEEILLDSAVTIGQSFFYKIVYSAAQTEAGQHWLSLSYTLNDSSKSQALTSSDAILTIFLLNPFGEPIIIYKKNTKLISCHFIENNQSI